MSAARHLKHAPARARNAEEIGGPESRAERLALAGAVAPTLRAAQERRIARVDADGNVVGYTTHKRLAESLLARQQIEIAVVEGVRPKTVMCEVCGLPAKVTKMGPITKGHKRCRDREHSRRCNEQRKVNPERAREWTREYIKTRRVELRMRSRQWSQANPEKRTAMMRKWATANPEKVLAHQAKNALRTGNPATAATRAEGYLRRAGWTEADIAAFLKARKP